MSRYFACARTRASLTHSEPRRLGRLTTQILKIAEIDEDSLTVKKDSLAVVDDRASGEPELIQFSNFQVIENRETLNFEIYMTRLGEDPDDPRRTVAYRYIYCNP